jgi:bacterioferritin (cytochrome b1)
MGTKLTICLSRRRRGFDRAAVFCLVVATLCIAGCGRSGHGAETDREKAADVEVLNSLLAQELTAVDSYERTLRLLRGRALALAQQLLGQDQAHLDALTKAIRGVGGETDAEASELEEPRPQTETEALTLAYEEENEALSEAIDSTPHLNTAAPRALAAALAASHAQHIVLLRQLLGTGLAASVPKPFENGEEPPPGDEKRPPPGGTG